MKRLLLPALVTLTLMVSAVGCCHRSCYDPSVACNCGTWQPLAGGWNDCCHCSHPWSPGPCCGPSYAGCGCEPCGPPACGCGAAPCAMPAFEGCGCQMMPSGYHPGPAQMMGVQPAPGPVPAPPSEDGKTTQYYPGNYYPGNYYPTTATPMMYSGPAPMYYGQVPNQMAAPGYNSASAPNYYNSNATMAPIQTAPTPVVPASSNDSQQWVPARN